jgi:hypothetical protein
MLISKVEHRRIEKIKDNKCSGIIEHTCGVPSERFHFSTRLIILQLIRKTILPLGCQL